MGTEMRWSRWNDDRLDDLAHNVERLVPLVESSARTSERLASLHSDMARHRQDLRDERETVRSEFGRLTKSIDDLYDRMDESSMAPIRSRRQLWHGVIAAVCGALITAGAAALIATGGHL